MPKICIVYGSETGHTRTGADMIAAALSGKGFAVTSRDVTETGVEVFGQGYDLYLLGVSTWGAVEEEVQQDFMPFYEAMAETDLTGRKVAVFGSGDEGYDAFAKAVDFVAQRARERGATVVIDSLKWHLSPEGSETAIADWVDAVANTVAA